MEHLGCRLLIDLSGTTELLHDPSLSGKVAHDPRLDRGKIADDESASGSCHECGTDQLRKHIRCGIIQKLHQVISAFLYKGACQFQVFHMVLRKVMDLHEPAGPSARAVGPVKL